MELCWVAGPSGAPAVTVNTSSSSALVCWQLPDRSDWNGHLLGCVVHYQQLTPTNLSLSVINVTDITQHCVGIDELQYSAEYQVSVSCFNTACLGPYSDAVHFIIRDEVLWTPPTDITAVPISSTSVQVSFLPPQFTEQRSDVYYVVTASRSVTGRVKRNSESGAEKTGSADGTVSVRGRLSSHSLQSVVVSGLAKFTKYYITVCCVTDAAIGPPSSPVTVHTLDDGMLCFLTLDSAFYDKFL